MAEEEPAPIVVVAPLDSTVAVVDVTAVHVDVRVPGPSSSFSSSSSSFSSSSSTSSLALLLADKSGVKVSHVGAGVVLFKWQMRTTIF